MRGNILVEQVDSQGNIVFDYDTSISTTEIFDRICRFFPNIFKDVDGMICGEYNGHTFAVRAKNITYLGNPHPIYKKRIQISDDLQQFYQNAIAKNRQPILLGVYTAEDAQLFCDFNIEDFIDKRAHNSSAHVYTSDLADAMEEGIFQKIDYFGNRITVFRPDAVQVFLDDLFAIREENLYGVQDEEKVPLDIFFSEGETKNVSVVEPLTAQKETSQRLMHYVKKQELDDLVSEFKKFFTQIDKKWHGIKCYQKMIADNYKNKYQPEWAGFYLEYEFETYINNNALNRIITYAQDKTTGGIDLDLYFPMLACYGDLKAHSDHSRGIQGNDWDTVFSLLEGNSHIYYIVCEHGTVKDSECNYEVTQYWNKVQNKPDLMSYSKRMKNSVELKKMYILDINPSNKQYLTMFKQGINSNGKLRAPKIMIEHDNLDKFVIAQMNLQ